MNVEVRKLSGSVVGTYFVDQNSTGKSLRADVQRDLPPSKRLKQLVYGDNGLIHDGDRVQEICVNGQAVQGVIGQTEVVFFRTCGYSVVYLKAHGVTAGELKKAGYPLAELKQAGFSAREALDGGYPIYLGAYQEGGFTISDVRDDFSLAQCKNACFTAAECKDAGFPVSQFKDAGFAVSQCKDAGFTAAQCIDAGFPVSQFKDAGFAVSQCKDAGFTVSQCKDAGFTAAQCIDAGFPISDVRHGFSLALCMWRRLVSGPY